MLPSLASIQFGAARFDAPVFRLKKPAKRRDRTIPRLPLPPPVNLKFPPGSISEFHNALVLLFHFVINFWFEYNSRGYSCKNMFYCLFLQFVIKMSYILQNMELERLPHSLSVIRKYRTSISSNSRFWGKQVYATIQSWFYLLTLLCG